MALDLFRVPSEEGQAPHLIGSRCRQCGRVSFPARLICPGCGREEVEVVPVGQRGRIQASAVVYNAPLGFTAPYVVALVALDEGPVIFCPLADCPPDEKAAPAGAPVELTIKPARPGGQPVIHYHLIEG